MSCGPGPLPSVIWGPDAWVLGEILGIVQRDGRSWALIYFAGWTGPLAHAWVPAEMVAAHCGEQLARAQLQQVGAYGFELMADVMVAHPRGELYWTLWPPETGGTGTWGLPQPPGHIENRYIIRKDLVAWQPGELLQSGQPSRDASNARAHWLRTGADPEPDPTSSPSAYYGSQKDSDSGDSAMD